jgi:hypothetical protein
MEVRPLSPPFLQAIFGNQALRQALQIKGRSNVLDVRLQLHSAGHGQACRHRY